LIPIQRIRELLERSIDKDFGHKEWIDNDDLDPIRNTTRFQAIAKAM
jgi:hypothetical protein